MATDQTFYRFPDLPAEIRLKIWAHAANSCPRIIDLWTDFRRCERANTMFFCQVYFIELATLTPPVLLSTSHESRREALKYYTLEFGTKMDAGIGLPVQMPAKWYVNWKMDMFVPKGFWNLVSFANFVSRGAKHGMKRLAIDVSGVFWRENLKEYVQVKNYWATNGVEELILYDSWEDPMWKGCDYLSKFKKKHQGGPMDLSFEELEEPNQTLRDVQSYLNRHWDRIESGTDTRDAVVEVPSYMTDFEATSAEEFVRPEVKLMKLVTTKF